MRQDNVSLPDSYGWSAQVDGASIFRVCRRPVIMGVIQFMVVFLTFMIIENDACGSLSAASPLCQTVGQIDSTTNADSKIDASMSEFALERRLQAVGLVILVIIFLTAIFYGYLKLELTTRGFYSGRLQFAAAVAVLLVATGAYLLWVSLGPN